MVDREIGVVLDALENSRFRDNTWILFTSDHGEGMSRHHLIGKGYFYREIVEVPMVLATLGTQLPVAKGTVDTEHFVSGIDVAATVCDALDADASRYPHGRSLLPLATGGKTGSWRKTVYAECAFSSRMVYDGRYKYIRDYRIEDEDFRAPGPDTHAVLLEQLFDLHEDAAESINLADRPDHAEILEALRTVMDQKERSLKRRPIPGTPGRNWIRNKLEICKQEEMFSCTAKPFIPTPDSPLKSVLKTC
jgi:choline-sulfatase